MMMIESFFKALVVLALICGSFGASLGSNDMHNNKCPKNVHAYCKCGVTTVKFPVDKCHNEETDQCGPCKESLASALKKCDRYKYCFSCYNDDGTCDTCLLNRTGPYCETEQNTTVVYENEGRRSKRGLVGKCDVPKMNAAGMECKIRKHSMACDVECVWGHKLPKDEDVQHFECDGETGEWSPYKIQDCETRVICDLELVRADVNSYRVCYFSQRYEPPKCVVTCGEKTSTHYCSKSGRWYPSLKNCTKVTTNKVMKIDKRDDGYTEEIIGDLDEEGKGVLVVTMKAHD